MKKTLILFCMMACSSVLFAQLKVASQGNIGIGTNPTADKKLNMDLNGAYEYGIYSRICSSRSWGMAIQATAIYKYDRQCAIYAAATNSTPATSGRAYGVLGSAGNRTPGYNYGIFGLLEGTNNGAGVCGTTTSSLPAINGYYAGYFYGNTYVSGNLTAQTVTTLSDVRHKTNIAQINNTALMKLSTLRPVQYNMRPYSEVMAVASDTGSVATKAVEKWEIDNNVHYGLIAQEVQEIYPELVQADGAGMLSINYIELIPLLIQSVQELSAQVASLKGTSARKAQAVETSTEIVPALYQNNPNPFTENTVIAYDLPSTTQNAALYIYDMNGSQIAQYSITSFGNNSLTIDGGSLGAGMYLYSLIADGKVIDTKRMILTK